MSPSLQAFLEVARQGTVHGAARKLRLTQTGVTQRIRSIEGTLRSTLFLRSRKGMKLTQEGEALYRYCQGVESLVGDVLSQIHGAAKDRSIHLTLVGPTSIMEARVVAQCLALYSKWPLLYLNFMISDAQDRLQFLRAGQAALAIVPPAQVPNEMDSKRLRPEKYVLVASAQWKGRKLQEVLESERAIDFDETDSTTLTYLAKHDLSSHLKRPRLYVNSNEGIIKLFCAGVGFGTLTQEIARSYLDSGQLIALNSGAVLIEEHALVWYPRPEMPAYLRDLIQAVK